MCDQSYSRRTGFALHFGPANASSDRATAGLLGTDVTGPEMQLFREVRDLARCDTGNIVNACKPVSWRRLRRSRLVQTSSHSDLRFRHVGRRRLLNRAILEPLSPALRRRCYRIAMSRHHRLGVLGVDGRSVGTLKPVVDLRAAFKIFPRTHP